MPFDLIGGLAVEDEADRELESLNQECHATKLRLADLAVLPHPTSDVITMTQLISESLAFIIEQETTNATKSFGS